MTSRLVTVDLILTTAVRLQRSALYPPTEDQLAFYGWIRELLNRWAKQIERRELAVQLETIAENALRLYSVGAEAASTTWADDLEKIGYQLIDRAREIESLTLNRSAFLYVPEQEVMVRALKEGERVDFSKAAMLVTGDTNSTRAKPRFKEFLKWVLGDWIAERESEAWRLFNEILVEEKQLTSNAIEYLKDRCYRIFEVDARNRSSEKIAKKFQNDANSV